MLFCNWEKIKNLMFLVNIWNIPTVPNHKKFKTKADEFCQSLQTPINIFKNSKFSFTYINVWIWSNEDTCIRDAINNWAHWGSSCVPTHFIVLFQHKSLPNKVKTESLQNIPIFAFIVAAVPNCSIPISSCVLPSWNSHTTFFSDLNSKIFFTYNQKRPATHTNSVYIWKERGRRL